jgi:Fe2+ transport system protein FeoA
MPKALSLCREGDKVYIHRIGGDGAFKKRLHDLGFRRGKSLSVVKYAPLKDPMEVELGGNHISLRVEEANRIEVDISRPTLN